MTSHCTVARPGLMKGLGKHCSGNSSWCLSKPSSRCPPEVMAMQRPNSGMAPRSYLNALPLTVLSAAVSHGCLDTFAGRICPFPVPD